MASTAPLMMGADKRRYSVRHSLGRQGTIRLEDDRAIEVIIADLTRDGCQIVTDEIIAPDTECRIGLANVGLRAARVVWRGETGYGCAFAEPLEAGAVTAAFGESNVAVLHLEQASRTLPSAGKLSPGLRATVTGALVVVPWTAIGGLFLLLR